MRTTGFGGLRIAFDHRVLTPRPWTEIQSRWAAEIAEAAPEGRLLELCSGAGHIGLLAAVLSGRSLVAVEVDAVACDYLRANATAAGLADRVEVREGDLCGVLDADERFPIVIADPPYLPTPAIAAWPEDPPRAIDGGADGLDVARACLAVAAHHLAEDGDLLLQLADLEQADRLVEEADWVELGRRRAERGVVVRWRRPGPP